MSTDQKVDDVVTEMLAGAGARECGRCGTRSSIPVQGSDKQLWFCFECGNEEEVAKGPYA